ncbi:hypothetical protein AA313_de0207999 [Arthrobotrys entomopaga]|nr:hypothetical protein AA313_de0207999 [Arthrobotrys entomopaga]
MALNQTALPATAAPSLNPTIQGLKKEEAVLLEACRLGVTYTQVRHAFCQSFNRLSMYSIDLKILYNAQSLQIKPKVPEEYFIYLMKLLEERLAILKREGEERQQRRLAERALVEQVRDLTLDQEELNARRALKLRAKQRLERDRSSPKGAKNAIRRRKYREKTSRLFKS